MKKLNIQIKKRLLTSILATILILLVLLALYYLFFPLIKNTELYTSANNFYKENVWVTYTSKNAKFSFKHPLSWPVSRNPLLEYKDKNRIYPFSKDEGKIEDIDFNEEWYANAGGPRLGLIKVVKTDGVNNLEDYIKRKEFLVEKHVEMYIKGRTQMVTIPPSKIEYFKIGGEDAINVTPGYDGLARLSNNTADYIVIRDGLLYNFVTIDSSRFLENKEKNSKIFHKLIDSVRFTD